MAKIDGLPHGACSRVAAELGVSASLVKAVARGERRNIRIEEALLRVKRDHEARMVRIRRLKEKIEALHIGEIK